MCERARAMPAGGLRRQAIGAIPLVFLSMPAAACARAGCAPDQLYRQQRIRRAAIVQPHVPDPVAQCDSQGLRTEDMGHTLSSLHMRAPPACWSRAVAIVVYT